jgi:hypothetical protein
MAGNSPVMIDPPRVRRRAISEPGHALRLDRGRRVEHRFWQADGGYDRNFTGGPVLTGMIDDIHANLVRRGPVERPADWKWSSAA